MRTQLVLINVLMELTGWMTLYLSADVLRMGLVMSSMSVKRNTYTADICKVKVEKALQLVAS